ncbi:hypothetical protein SSP24_45620 [Streptomyces spinoverrucosus]|uniref:HTH araC/xylS-type domain-containing protein n=1 Tax=Streptomyces spinoverrucosus TaxID=284043 RepID=A0A4Y3VJ76_9ACTN|nr:hypothetical protein SSP24_45620 [Streptomyces spinoverrucosus]GHB85019.1 hypothetical protein GCM10010397_65480 [Streptomyces spinoverrucosus]
MALSSMIGGTSVDQVAARVGLGTAANLRQHFHAAVGTSPSAYRATFRGTGAAA